jgi:hypothetical protein
VYGCLLFGGIFLVCFGQFYLVVFVGGMEGGGECVLIK